ncbi:MAG: beta-N-acetylhexosaminidase [Bdellovibrionales bacterium]
MNHKLGQLMMIGLEGTTLTPDEAEFMVLNNIGGVCLFSRNYESPEQLYGLCQSIQALQPKMADKAPLFIAVDMEGGRVQRFKEPFTVWPPAWKLGELGSNSMAFRMGQAMGEELRAVGVNLNFSPCIDVLTNPKNQVIGDRALSDDPNKVTTLASGLVRGFIKANIIPCAKHFPGHGNTLADSHEELPVEETSLETLLKRELVPFKKAFRSRLDMVLVAHILFKNIDPDHPVTFSEKFLKQILREDLRYRGLAITDDLDMKALSANYTAEEIPVKALAAGMDMLLYCNDFSKPPIACEALDKALKDKVLGMNAIDESYNRVMEIKKETLAKIPPISLEEAKAIIGSEQSQLVAQAIATGKIPDELATSTT